MNEHVWLAVAAKLLLPAATLIIGTRLLAMARRTRQLPELMIGLTFVLAGGVGGASFAAFFLAGFTPGYALGMAGIAGGAGCLAFFVWRTFRPGTLGGLLFAAIVVPSAGLTALEVAGRYGWTQDPSLLMHSLANAIRTSSYVWAMFESLAYFGQMRRRARIGLSDPFVANAFLLWGVGAGAAALTGLMSIVGRIVDPVIAAGGSALWLDVVTATLGVVASAALWLAFIPPLAYRAWVTGSAESSATG